MNSSMHLQAPAKLNLALSVGPPGEDRMHPIVSWMVTINLADEVELLRLEEPTISMYAVQWHTDARRRTEIDWPMSQDLAARAHMALEEHVGRALPVRMKIEKRIPLGSGLGGGSSDAAAVLRGVNDLFELGLGLEELARIGSSLGSDVPFLVHGGSAIVEGLGEQVQPLQHAPQLHAVVAFPEIHCSTAHVYGWFDDLSEESGEAALQPEKIRKLAEDRLQPEAPFNDLTEPACRAEPGLAVHVQQIAALADRPAHVTGSGSGIFVVCDEAIHAEALASAIEEQLDLAALAVSTCEAPASIPG